MPKALITTIPFGEADPTSLRLLKEAGIDYLINPLGRKFNQSELQNYMKDINYIIAGTDQINAEVIKSSPQLEMISRVGIGLDGVDLLTAKDLGIKVSYTPDGPTEAVAEFAMSLILSTMRQSYRSFLDMKQGQWKKYLGRSISDSVIGVFGVGRIGKEVIKLLSAFNPKKIMVYDPHIDPDTLSDYDLEWTSKEEICRQSNLITFHLPLNEDTTNFITSKEILNMPRDSIIINTSRGGIINESDLYKAMSNGHLLSAAIDVFEEEPYSGPLTKLDNCFVTAHMSPMSSSSRSKMEIDATKEVIRFSKNDKLQNEVPQSEYNSRLK